MANSDREPFITSTVLDQTFLDEAHDNLLNQLELIVDVETPTGIIHISDRNKYVGDTYYEARMVFPVIGRTIGELQSPELEFSTLQIEINNVDGKYNDILPAGANYDGWIGRRITVKLGLREAASTYKTIFSGLVTEEGGFQRTNTAIILVARNDFDKMNVQFPKSIFTKTAFPNLEDDKANLAVPIIYGDWTTNLDGDLSAVTAYAVNGLDDDVNGTVSRTNLVSLVISENDLTSFSTSTVYVKRSDTYVLFDPSDVVNIGAGNKSFQLRHGDTVPAGVTQFEGSPYNYEKGDSFYVQVVGKNLGAYTNNSVEQARDILKEFAGILPSQFDANWDVIRDKATPAQSAIANIKCRIWAQEPQSVLTYALSILEQVRVEMFLSRDLKLKLSTLHFEDFIPNAPFTAANWDIERGTLKPKLDERANFNRAKAVYNYLPSRNENFSSTAIYRNSNAITQAKKEISKKIVFPNLYIESDVINQLVELLRLASSYLENVDLTLTWRSMLLDIGDFIKMNVDIQGVVYNDVPAQVRSIGYDPNGLKIPARLWSFQLVPFPGWSPGFNGITGGYAAVILQET